MEEEFQNELFSILSNKRGKNFMLKEIKSDIYHILHPKITFFLTSIDRKAQSIKHMIDKKGYKKLKVWEKAH